MDKWTYLPMQSCIRTRVNLNSGDVQQKIQRAYRKFSCWTDVHYPELLIKIDSKAEKMADKVIQKSRKGGKFRPINTPITEQQAIDYLTSLGYVVTKPVDVRAQWDEEHF